MKICNYTDILGYDKQPKMLNNIQVEILKKRNIQLETLQHIPSVRLQAFNNSYNFIIR